MSSPVSIERAGAGGAGGTFGGRASGELIAGQSPPPLSPSSGSSVGGSSVVGGSSRRASVNGSGAADAPLNLLPGWQQITDAATARVFYYNKATKEKRWKAPLATN